MNDTSQAKLQAADRCDAELMRTARRCPRARYVESPESRENVAVRGRSQGKEPLNGELRFDITSFA